MFADLDKPDLKDCIQECSDINADFSQDPCHGVSFLQYSTGVHCNYLGLPELSKGTGHPLAISAVLLSSLVVEVPVVGK